MPELIEQMYCAQQIVIPPKYPYILKRYCKAAIKTQPYDLLRWSYEYFKAMTENRPPPVKLRLEYPIYGTEGGLTRGCLKVLAKQLAGMKEVPITIVKRAWQGFCLDPHELVRILCYCEVYSRAENVPMLHFIAVAGGMLTKCLTHTMILLCETLTQDPDGGAAAIPVLDFLEMYHLLAKMDCSKDCKYIRGYREGYLPYIEEAEDSGEEEGPIFSDDEDSSNSWEDNDDLMKINVISAKIPMSNRLSIKMNLPVIGYIQRSPSVERAGMIERENYMRERKEKPHGSEEVDKMLQEMSAQKVAAAAADNEEAEKSEEFEVPVEIHVYDEDENEIELVIYGEDWEDDEEVEEEGATEMESETVKQSTKTEEAKTEDTKTDDVGEAMVEGEGEDEMAEALPVVESILDHIDESRHNRVSFLMKTFEEIREIVDKYHSTNYDLGMIAGRQMSTTSGEFIVQYIEKEIMEYIDDQIAVLPDPDFKRKKAKPEEVTMIKEILETFLEENIDIICPEVEEVEEEEEPIPEIVTVYAIPGIGPPVEDDIIETFENFARDVSISQAEMFMPRNIRHFLCPPLDKFEEPKLTGFGTTIELPEK